MSEQFGRKLRNRRKEKNITLDGLAKAVGTTKAYIWQLENKKPAKPSGELLLKIANTLDIAAEFLIDDDFSEPSEKHVRIALARGSASRGYTQKDIDKLFRIADSIGDGKVNKKGE